VTKADTPIVIQKGRRRKVVHLADRREKQGLTADHQQPPKAFHRGLDPNTLA
jgi:hypothetical protein